MTTKIIFLDIDGVLNNALWYKETNGHRGRDDLSPDNIKFLNELIENTGAKVVVTSTWRLNRTVEELQEILARNGFVGEIVGKTIDMRRGEDSDCILRGNEILQWMKAHPVELGCAYYDYKDYVILDDDSDMLYWQKDNYIHVDPYCGLTPWCIYKAKKLLNGKYDSLKEM